MLIEILQTQISKIKENIRTFFKLSGLNQTIIFNTQTIKTNQNDVLQMFKVKEILFFFFC
jgi:hypothetical protein